MTPALVAAIEEHPKCLESIGAGTSASDKLAESEPSLACPAVGNPISHGQFIDIAGRLRDLAPKSGESASLELLLRGSQVYIPPPRSNPVPTPEYQSLMARLRREEEARSYERMLNPPPQSETFAQRFSASPHSYISPKESLGDSGEDEDVTYADVNRQMALILNVLISIVACSIAIWMVARHWSVPQRLGLSMVGSGLVGVAEVVVYAGYLRRVREAKSKGRRKVETKEILRTWVIGAGSGEGEKMPEDWVSNPSQATTFRKR
ncbi:MAG: hypothetical protein M1833_002366 [Piccolia ochrophora]|nr:MAG: hypothetical protein M1833_002366 [Piccolia ochrophora]